MHAPTEVRRLPQLLVRRIIPFLALLIGLQTSALATWSVLAVDRATGRVVISSATCAGNTDDFLKDVQAVVVPGVGVAACQAGVDGTHQNQKLVFQELKKRTDPKKIIELLSQDPQFQGRQYGIVDLEGRSAGHSGLANGFATQNIGGQVPGTEIFYLIQGNVLRHSGVVRAGVKAFLAAKGGVTDRAMAAMEAADAAGGDSRCTCTAPPIPEEVAAKGIACQSRTALVAYILAADRGDMDGDPGAINSHSNGKYAMYIALSTPTIRPRENLNPVKTLRMRYDAWIKARPNFKR